MSLLSTAEQTEILSARFNGVALSAVTDWYVALYIATLGEYASGEVTSLGATIVPSTPNNRTYKVTTVGSTALTPSVEPTWPTTDGATVTDANGNIWTEQTPAIRSGTITEASGGGYARQAIPATTAGLTVGSANSIGNVPGTNAAIVSFGAMSANIGWVVGAVLFDALTGGVLRYIAENMTPQQIVKGNTPEYAIGQISFIPN